MFIDKNVSSRLLCSRKSEKYHLRSSLKMLHRSIFLTLGFESPQKIKRKCFIEKDKILTFPLAERRGFEPNKKYIYNRLNTTFVFVRVAFRVAYLKIIIKYTYNLLGNFRLFISQSVLIYLL